MMRPEPDLAALNDLLAGLLILPDAASEKALVESLLTRQRPTILSFLNQHALNLAAADPAFRRYLVSADVLLRDGVGIEMALRLFGLEPGRNANGTDFIPRLLHHAGNRRVALFGTSQSWLALSARAVGVVGPRVVATCDGFREDAVYLDLAQRSDPDIVVLGMGMPRQERLASLLAAQPGRPRLIVNGGAILDFLAGRFRRAPLWLRSARLEWAYRMAQEPRRLGPRYVNGGGRFAVTVARLRRAQDRSL